MVKIKKFILEKKSLIGNIRKTKKIGGRNSEIKIITN